MIVQPGVTVYGHDGAEIEILDPIGNGSFGIVHKAKRRSDAQVFAVKTIYGAFSDQFAVKAFVNEGHLAVGIHHPNVIQYHFFHDGSKYENLPPYIVMEYADGGTLEGQINQAARSGKPFSNDDLIAMFKALVSGMKAVNEKLIHRDLKPDNVLISQKTLKISDFGLSKVVTDGTRASSFKGVGCLPYMAPEAWNLEKNTLQLDIYSMGMVFYKLATLRLPFDISFSDQTAWKEAHLYQAVPNPKNFNPGLATTLSQVIIKMVEKNITNRFKNWTEIDSFFGAQVSASTDGVNLIVERMLESRLRQDTATQAAEAERQRKANERAKFCKLVLSQARNEIVTPIEGMISQFNQKYPGTKAQAIFEPRHQRFVFQIVFSAGVAVVIDFEPLHDENFVRDVPAGWNRLRPGREVLIPKFQHRRVQGWGKVGGNDGRGFNILLVEVPGQLYGELFIIEKSGGISLVPGRPNTGPFETPELELELRHREISNDYSNGIRRFDPQLLLEFISNYV
jgi:eukaryotic-like serine/threonine-protein kinase